MRLITYWNIFYYVLINAGLKLLFWVYVVGVDVLTSLVFMRFYIRDRTSEFLRFSPIKISLRLSIGFADLHIFD